MELEFRLERARSGNTFDGHRLVHLAADYGLQNAMKEPPELRFELLRRGWASRELARSASCAFGSVSTVAGNE